MMDLNVLKKANDLQIKITRLDQYISELQSDENIIFKTSFLDSVGLKEKLNEILREELEDARIKLEEL